MIFRVSNASERLVGRLDDGEDLVDELTQVCINHGVTAGEIRAVGHFDAIELVHFDVQEQRYVTLVDGEGSYDLVSLNGNVSQLGGEVALRLDAVFNVLGPLGPQMVGGQLRRARAIGAEFVVDSFEDLEMERSLDSDTGRLVLSGIERKKSAPKPASKPTSTATQSKTEQSSSESSEAKADESQADDEGPSMSWNEAIAEAEETENSRKKRRQSLQRKGRTAHEKSEKKENPYADFDLDEPLMDKGDLVDHPKLGRCRVLSVEDGQFCRIRLPRGRIRKLAMEILEFEYKGEEDGKNVFEARVRR